MWIGSLPYQPRTNEKPLTVEFIKNKWRHEKSPIVLVVGHRRVGKTSFALRLAFELNPKFDIENDMYVDIEKFLIDIEKFDNSVKVLDEVGASLDPHEHFNKIQRVYSHITQTQGYKNNILILCLPFASEFGKEHRKHINFLIKVFDRGCYESFFVLSDPADLSLKPPPLFMIERVTGYPLPPKNIWEKYKATKEKQQKEAILRREIQRLQIQNIEKERMERVRGSVII